MRRFIPFLYFLLVFVGCQSRKETNVVESGSRGNDPQKIIDAAIATHGGEEFENLHVSFDFRDRHYEAIRKRGLYTYTRSFTDSTGQVKDVLTNNGFTRTVNGQKQQLPAERVKAFSASVNSVIYFALLPYGLNDPAVKKELMGTATIRKKPYYKIKVTFSKEGGGSDFQDEFLYFIHQETTTLDYFGYTYATEGGGVRFREAINPRKIGGTLFQDYINFEPKADVNFWQIEQAFEKEQLKEFSRIQLLNIQVKPI